MGSTQVKVTLMLSPAPDGCDDGISASVDFSDRGRGATYPLGIVQQPMQLATAGNPGAVFVAVPTPPVVQAIGMQASAPVCVRYNGAPAKVTGSGAAFSTIAGADSFTLAVDNVSTSVVFEAGDTTLAAVIARINALAGAIIASADTTGTQLVLTGARSGGAAALARAMQYGFITLSGSALGKLGLVAGTTYGSGDDRTTARLYDEPSTTSPTGPVTKIELSGTASVALAIYGRAS